MQDEAEKSSKHEIEMTNLLLNAAVPSNQPTENVPTQCSTMQFWPQEYNPGAPHFQHHQPSFQAQYFV